MHNNFCNAKISPITIEEASGAAAAVKKFMRTGGQQVKGKQVEDLYDLVTVSRNTRPCAKARSLRKKDSWINCRESFGKAVLCDDL